MIAAALAAFALVNLAAFALIVWDKRAAQRGAWRVSERTLLTLAALGGSPCAYAAQRLVRHKTSKPSFRRAFALIVAAQIALAVAVAWYAGAGRIG